MQQDKPKQLRGPVALDFDVSGMPTKSAAQSGFGLGYTIGFLTCVALTAASFAALFLAGSERGRIRAAGYILVSFGAFFTFAVVYTLVTGKGISWAASGFGRVQTGEWDRKTTPIRFWACCAIMLLI